MVVSYIKPSNMIRISYRSCGDKNIKEFKLTSIGEFLRLYRSANWYRSDDNADDLYAPYFGKVKEEFDNFLKRYFKRTKARTIDFSKKFITHVDGTSKLVYQPGKGTIHLALRRSRDNVTSLSSICISNELRDAFIEDCMAIDRKKFMISSAGENELFLKWCSIIQNEYIQQYIKEKV